MIIMGLLDDLKIPYSEIKSRDGGDYEIPSLKGERYTIFGAGKSNVDVQNREVRFYGNSLGYRIGIDQTHLKEIQKIIPNWVLKSRL